MKRLTLTLMLVLVGCSSTGVVPVGADSFMIAQRSAQIGFGPPDGVKADVYREANAFCGKDGKAVDTIDLQITNSGLAKPGNVSLTFRCVEVSTK